MCARRPRLSVLLPVRNAASYLDTCLASLAEQSLRDFEIIAIDDCSADGSEEILASWRRQEPRLRTIQGSGTGLVSALNLGLEHCATDLIARMDADDRAHPNRFLLQAALFEEQPDLAVAACQVEHFSNRGVGQGLRVYERWLNSLLSHEDMRRERFVESPVPHPAVMYRRAVVEAAGGYRDVGWPEDYDLWLRLFEAGHHFAKVPEVLHFWRDRSDRLTRTDSRYAVERFLECKAEHLMLGPLRNCRELIVWGAGQTGRRLTKHLLRRSAPLTSFLDIDPAKWGRTVRGVIVEAPPALDRITTRSGAGTVILAAVSSRGARAKIRTALDGRGLREGENYWCVA
ncbi:MAG: glycosyltransferase [bacterium]|nr:glycosyltransferase [bacterium]